MLFGVRKRFSTRRTVLTFLVALFGPAHRDMQRTPQARSAAPEWPLLAFQHELRCWQTGRLVNWVRDLKRKIARTDHILIEPPSGDRALDKKSELR